MDWKFLLGLELDDPGFDFSVLSDFRSRLIKHGLEERVLDLVLARCSELGLLRAGGRPRTDSTHVLAAVRTLNRMEFVGESLRAALEALVAAAPEWLSALVGADWVKRYGARIDSYRLPKGDNVRREWAEQVGRDGFTVVSALKTHLPIGRLEHSTSGAAEGSGCALIAAGWPACIGCLADGQCGRRSPAMRSSTMRRAS
jgi:hypothetical protein